MPATGPLACFDKETAMEGKGVQACLLPQFWLQNNLAEPFPSAERSGAGLQGMRYSFCVIRPNPIAVELRGSPLLFTRYVRLHSVATKASTLLLNQGTACHSSRYFLVCRL